VALVAARPATRGTDHENPCHPEVVRRSMRQNSTFPFIFLRAPLVTDGRNLADMYSFYINHARSLQMASSRIGDAEK
jgi:hypothetical protein